MIRLAIIALAILCAGASYRTPNFVVTAPTPELAREIGDQAEHSRATLAQLWFGASLPKWAHPCPITARVDPQLGAGGATSFVFDRGEVFNWQMSIQGSRERLLDSVVPHEVLHTVFASCFRQPLPRWADEGACTTAEYSSEQQRQRVMLIGFLREDRGIAFSRMFAMKKYPPDVMPLYAQGFSLCEFLLHHAGRGVFVDFIADGLDGSDWSEVVRGHYRFGGLERLQAAWLDWVKAGSPRPSPVHQVAYRGETKSYENTWDEDTDQWVAATDDNCARHPAEQQQSPANTHTPAPATKPRPTVPAVRQPPTIERPPNPYKATPQADSMPSAKPTAVSALPAPSAVDGEAQQRLKAMEAIVFGLAKRPACECQDGLAGRAGTEAATTINTASRHSGSISAGWLSWLGDKASPLAIAGLGAIGISPPLAAVVWWLARRKMKRVVAQHPIEVTHVIGGTHTRGPTVVDERHHNHYVEVPLNETDRAWADAHRRMVEAYPGCRKTLEMTERLKDQLLKGENARPGVV